MHISNQAFLWQQYNAYDHDVNRSVALGHFYINILHQIGGKICDLNELDRGVIGGGRRACLSFSMTGYWRWFYGVKNVFLAH